MDSKQILKKYVKPSSAALVAGIVLLALAAALLVGGIISANNAKANAAAPVQFNSRESESGSYVYLDVVGISNWLYNDEGAIYYTAVDADANLYTVRVSDSDYNKMTAQQEYWLDENQDAPQPEPYRLTGLAAKAGTTLQKALSESWEILPLEYNSYFGTMYLNATTDPVAEAGVIFFVFAFMCFLFSLVLCIAGIMQSVNFNKTVQALEQANLLDRAAAELNDPSNMILGKDRARLSQNFLFGKGTNAVVPYSDIQWVYHRNLKQYFITVNCCLIVNTLGKTGITAVNFGKADKHNELGRGVDLMAQRNPNMLLGFTNENRKAYNDRKKAAKIG